MSKLSVRNHLGSKTSQRTVKTKESLVSKKSRCSGSLTSEHGSRFGRSVNRIPRPNDPGLVQTLSVENSRIIRTFFNPILSPEAKLPDLTETNSTDSIRELGKSLNILDYEFNYASFWLLDIVSKYLKDLQLKSFPSSHQEKFLSWFRFVLRCISITGSSREEIFTLLQEMFKSAVEIIEESTSIPAPEDIDIGGSGDTISPKLSADLKSAESVQSSKESVTSRKVRKRTLSQRSTRKSSDKSGKSKKSVSRKSSGAVVDEVASGNNDEYVRKQNMESFNTIIEMLYQIFAERFSFMVTSLAYSSPNVVTLVDLKIEFNDPKTLKTEPDPPPTTLTAPDSPKTGTKGRKKSKDKGKKKKEKKKSSTTIGDDKDSNAKSSSRKKSRGTSKISTDINTDIVGKKTKDKKGKSENGPSSSKKGKGKGKEKPVKSKLIGEIEDERSEKVDEDPHKLFKSKEGKINKSKDGLKSKSKVSDVNEETEKKSAKSKKGKEKGKTKKEEQDLDGGDEKEKPTKSKEKAKTKSTKSDKKKKKSTMSNPELQYNHLDGKEVALLRLRKQFDRPVRTTVEEETEMRNKFILPLSEAVDKKYVENLIYSLLPPPPPEVQKEAEPKLMRESVKKEKGKSKKSSIKSQKKKPKSKKK